MLASGYLESLPHHIVELELWLEARHGVPHKDAVHWQAGVAEAQQRVASCGQIHGHERNARDLAAEVRRPERREVLDQVRCQLFGD